VENPNKPETPHQVLLEGEEEPTRHTRRNQNKPGWSRAGVSPRKLPGKFDQMNPERCTRYFSKEKESPDDKPE
jgi:hypothetical protein